MFITHDLSVVKHISHNIMVMYLGMAVEVSETDELFERPLHPYTKALFAAIPVPDLHHKNKMIPVSYTHLDVYKRQASNYQALVDTVWRGHAKVADSFLAPAVLGYKYVGPYTYDVELSKQLLAEAGYPDGFEFDFITWENDYNPQVAQVLQSMWAEVGIKMNIQVVDLPSFLTSFNAGELQVTHTGATAVSYTHLPREFPRW